MIFVGIIIGMFLGVIVVNSILRKKHFTELLNKEKQISKFKIYYNLLNKWLYLKEKNRSVDGYFEERKYKKIAIYGVGEMGKRLHNELKYTNLEVAFFIDSKGEGYDGVKIYRSTDVLPNVDVDVVVISVAYAVYEIAEELCEKFKCPIVSIEDVVEDVYWDIT